MGNSSFAAIDCPTMARPCHGTWNHSVLQKAPQPQLPEASVHNTTSGVKASGLQMIATPFQNRWKTYPHSMSALHSTFRRMTWCGWKWLVPASRS